LENPQFFPSIQENNNRIKSSENGKKSVPWVFFSQADDFQDPEDKTQVDEKVFGPMGDVFVKKYHEQADQSHINQNVDIHQAEAHSGIPPLPFFEYEIFVFHLINW
jgi:hypothetical protein